MKRAATIALLLLACQPILGTGGKQGMTEDERLQQRFKTYLDAEFKLHPLDATRNGDHRFDHLLDDVSAKARAGGLARARKTLAELPKEIEYKKLTRDGQIDFEIWQQQLKREIWLAENTNP